MKQFMMASVLAFSAAASAADVCTISTFQTTVTAASGVSADGTMVSAECTDKKDSSREFVKNTPLDASNRFPTSESLQEINAANASLIKKLMDLKYQVVTDTLLVRH